ncbi:MAG: lipid-binding SYLF domain-containing protein [Acidobacteria bacterium]|nr:lipid-binding SYLF domain-containing protein [Acidobacteriota bacterium]
MKNVLGVLTAVVLMLAPLLAATISGKETRKINDRLEEAKVVLEEIMRSGDSAIPESLLKQAHCVAVVPGAKQGGFIVGAKFGKGFLTCRDRDGRGWSAPANLRVEGGSIGLQIGGGETDLVLLVMNESGADRLMRSEFKVGGEASAMAGPVGRSISAETDALMRAEMLSYSRSRGLFAGVSLQGSTLREDRDANRALYGVALHTPQIVRERKASVPPAAQPLVALLGTYSPMEAR